MIVIVAPEDDLHARSVADALERIGGPAVFWVDLENAFENLSLEWQVNGSGLNWAVISRKDPASKLTPDKITAVYWRRVVRVLNSPFLTLPTSGNLDRYEIFWSLRWLIEALPADLFPLGQPHALGRADNKHRQWQAAIEVGLRLPASFHSNDTAALSRFVSTQRTIALKALKMPGVVEAGSGTEARHIFCRSFSPEFLLEKFRSVERTQLFCQEAVRRERDLRIMVFPHAAIAAEIDLTSLKDNKLDWREDCLELPHRIVPLAPGFEHQLRAFLRQMDLKAGYFDFAVPETGPPVFFECNTNAQWVWIEQMTGHSIGEVIARELAGLP